MLQIHITPQIYEKYRYVVLITTKKLVQTMSREVYGTYWNESSRRGEPLYKGEVQKFGNSEVPNFSDIYK